MTSFPKIHPYPPWTGPRNNSVGTDKARKRHSKTTDPSKKPEVAQALVPRRTSGPEREKMEVAGAVGLVLLPVLGRVVGALVLDSVDTDKTKKRHSKTTDPNKEVAHKPWFPDEPQARNGRRWRSLVQWDW